MLRDDGELKNSEHVPLPLIFATRQSGLLERSASVEVGEHEY